MNNSIAKIERLIAQTVIAAAPENHTGVQPDIPAIDVAPPASAVKPLPLKRQA
jgi:hypothetical protein